ncbi:TetR/AcrR family transcriptional regulator [Jeotgalibacillus salarius]|uniref:TetR/AcrR family transcriptional regulator n=1 Tax=Jeotgalibacillus salarius TaxID=546023 RepID=A0A4Y8LFX9_9BACL|nr:TetR-like C-terminal domain-containing protein [Jeotgalibacillus salarius]TFE01546.1 TetR/AcrR family transcriptional regulator [Jeotgalibacillus salarius]
MKQDLRVKKTKKAIRHALLRLVDKKTFARISVSDICDEAEINRGTFYLHYTDKFDLLEKIQQELLDHLWMIVTTRMTEKINVLTEKPDTLKIFATELFHYLDQEADLFYMLLVNTVDPSFHNRLKGLIQKNMERLSHPAEEPVSFHVDYVMAYVTSAIVGMLQHWLANGRKIPPEEMALLVVKINLNGPMKMMSGE